MSKKSKRPTSPHVTVYKPQITSVLSITHRITGVALYAGAVVFALWIIFNVYGCSRCINPLLGSTVGQVFLVLWSMALFYHLLNGIRHLFWDAGLGYEIRTVTTTGWVVIIGTFLLTIITWFASIGLFELLLSGAL